MTLARAADPILKDRVFQALKCGSFASSKHLVDVSDGPCGDIHLVVISRMFDRMNYKQRHEIVREELELALTQEELSEISLCVVVSPEIVKSIF